MKILVTSASRKLPLLRAIAAELGDDVVAGDSDPNCLAAYAWPRFWNMPQLDASSVDAVADAMVANHFQLVIPTRDADVALLAGKREDLAGAGVAVMAAAPRAVAMCHDKFAFATALITADLPAIPTWSAADPPAHLPDRLVVKERVGAGSRNLTLDVEPDLALKASALLDDPLLQPYVEGRELSIDAYRSREGEVLGLVARARDLVIAGESQVTTTVDPSPFSELVSRVLEVLGVEGHAVLQVIESASGPQIVECNPRVGGASTLAFAAGLRSLQWFAAEARGSDPRLIPFAPKPFPLRLIRIPQDDISAPRL